MKLDADEKALLESVEGASGSPPTVESASMRGTPATPKPPFARIVG